MLLQRFNGDVKTKEALREYINQVLSEEIIRRVFARQDVSHIADAKSIIDKAFEQLSNEFATPEKAQEDTNKAR
jgi:hypothetical protein